MIGVDSVACYRSNENACRSCYCPSGARYKTSGRVIPVDAVRCRLLIELPELRSQIPQFVQQVESKRDARGIDAKILSQSLRASNSTQADSAKIPAFGVLADRLDDTFLHQLNDALGRQLSRATDLGQAQYHLFFEDRSDNGYSLVFASRHRLNPDTCARIKIKSLPKICIRRLRGRSVGFGQRNVDNHVKVSRLLRRDAAVP